MTTSQNQIKRDQRWLVEAKKEQEEYGRKLMDKDFAKDNAWDSFVEYLKPIERTPLFPMNREALEQIWGKMEQKSKNISKDLKKAEICLRLLFIIGITDENQRWKEPILKICNKTNDNELSFFIDSTSRVYKSWKDYLKNNVLPKGEFVYPKSGKYELNELSEFILETGKPPASEKARKVLKVLDYTSTACCVAGVGVGLLTLTTLPVSAPFVATALGATFAGGGYSITRSSCKLADRKEHGQSIGLKDETARSEWLNIINTTIITGSAGCKLGTMVAAKFGREVGAIGNSIMKGISRTSKSVRVVNGLTKILPVKEMELENELRVFFFFLVMICQAHNSSHQKL